QTPFRGGAKFGNFLFYEKALLINVTTIKTLKITIMKISIKSILIIGLMMTSLFSCKENNDNESSQKILGKWTWISTQGAFMDTPETPITTGLNTIYTFNADLSFTEEVNGSISRTGAYTIFMDDSQPDWEGEDFVSFTFDAGNTGSQTDYLIGMGEYIINELDNEEMIFGSAYLDGNSYSFEKIAE
ncbi:MAG: hypothetical protein ACPG5P_09510, partial [Saprospiraceae bacterium]